MHLSSVRVYFASFNMADYIIRKIERDDSRRLWEIRNHFSARQNSGTLEEIPFEKHDQWFENKYFKNSDNICFVLEKEENIIGYCRFDVGDEDRYIISIALDHVNQGRGLGHLLLSGSLIKLTENREILATVKKGNPASVKLFQKNNFQMDKEDEINYYFIFRQNSYEK